MSLFQQFKRELFVLFVSVVPFIELRGAIPIGVGMGLSPLHALGVALVGNLLLVPVLLWILDPVLRLLSKIDIFNRILVRLREKSSDKYVKTKEKYGAFALYVFVAIPLPGTGAWSGSLVAKIFQIPTRQALISISAGVITAGIIVGLLSNIITLF